GNSIRVLRLCSVVSTLDRGVVLEGKHEVGRIGCDALDGGGGCGSCSFAGNCSSTRAWVKYNCLGARRCGAFNAHTGWNCCLRLYAGGADGDRFSVVDDCRVARYE